MSKLWLVLFISLSLIGDVVLEDKPEPTIDQCFIGLSGLRTLTNSKNGSAYICPTYQLSQAEVDSGMTQEQIEVALKYIDFATGKYTCSYSTPNKELKKHVFDSGCSKAYAEAIAKLDITKSDEASKPFVSAGTHFGPYEFAKVTDLSKMTNINDAWDTLAITYNEVRNHKVILAPDNYLSKSPIDSHSDYEKTLPSILVGILTLDPAVFNTIGGKTSYVNSVGEVDIKPELTQIFTYDESSWWLNLWNRVVGDTTTHKMSQVDMLDFFDKQLLGYYIYLSMNLKEVYLNLIYIFFLFGVAMGTGTYAWKKGMEKYGKQQFSFNGVSKSIVVATSFLFFTAPTVYVPNASGITDDTHVYEDQSRQKVANFYEWNTGAQEMIRYFANISTYFGNWTSDAGMYSYLTYIQHKQGMMTKENIKQLEMEGKKYHLDALLLNAQTNFYYEVCNNFYDAHYWNFRDKSNEALNNLYISTKKPEIMESVGMEGIQRLEPEFCREVEGNFYTLARSMIVRNGTLAVQAEAIKTSVDNNAQLGDNRGESNEQLNFRGLVAIMAMYENQYGWLASVIAPVSKTFFEHANLFFANNKELLNKQDGNDNSFTRNIELATDNTYKANIGETVMDELDGASQIVANYVVGASIWFAIPGFSDIYSTVNTFINKYIFDVADPRSSSEDRVKQKKSSLSKLTKFLLNYAPLRFLPDILDTGTAIFAAVISFIVARIFINFILTTAITVGVAIMLIFKISMFFFELVLYFFTTPIVAFWSVIVKDQGVDYLGTFLKNGSILMIVPILTSSSAYLLVFISEFFIALFEGLIGSVYAILNSANSFMSYSDGAGVVESITGVVTKTGVLASLHEITSLLAYMLTLIIAFIVIFNFRGWVTTMIGFDAKMDLAKETSSQLNERVQKYISPL